MSTGDDTITLDLGRRLLRTMVLIRRFEERALTLRAARHIIGPVHPYIGQEAVAAGVCDVLDARDRMVTTYRGHGHALARGIDVRRFTAELFGRRTGVCAGKAAGHFCDRDTGLLAASGIIGGGVPIAAGAAMAAQLHGAGGIAVCFLGDGALGAGVVHEVMNIASTQHLPLVMVCEHNLYQSGTRTEAVTPDIDLTRIAEGHRIATATVDGNDVGLVRAAAARAVDRARAGDGPSFLQMNTYLTQCHIHFDRPSTEVRPPAELAFWAARDPIDRCWNALSALGARPQLADELNLEVAAVIDDAVAWAQDAPWPEPADLYASTRGAAVHA